MKTYVAIDPNTGRHLRPATEAEADEYERVNERLPVARQDNQAIRVGEISVERSDGRATWTGGAGF